MKIMISILLFSLHFSLAQVNQIAVITNPEVGPQSNAMNLIDVVKDINNHQDITQVIVIGNITANGKIDEFVWAQEILDELTASYFVVGGEKDYLQSEGKGSELSLFWGDDKFFHYENNYSLVCMNSFLPEYPSKKYFNAETLSWLEKNLNENKTMLVLLFSHYPIQTAENNSRFLEKMVDKKIFSFVGKEDKSLKSKSSLEGLYLNRKDGWGYLVASIKKDSIQIKKILSEEIKKKTKPEIIKSAFTKPVVLETKRQESYITAGTKIWSTSVNASVVTSTLYNADNIYTSFKNGLILCLNDKGKEKWRFETNEKLYKSSILENDLIVTVSDDGDIITINSKTGNHHQIIGLGERITTGVSVIDIDEGGTSTKAVVIGTEFGGLFCYDLYSLNPIWTQQVSGMGESLQLVSNIVTSNNKVIVQDNYGTLYCFSAVNGMLIWEIVASKGGWKAVGISSASSKQNIKIINNELFLVDAAGNLFCIDALLGTVKWDIKNINAIGLIRLSSQQELFLRTKKNTVAIVSPKLGKITSEIEFPIELSDESITELVVIGNTIIVGFSSGWVYKIKLKQKVEKFFRSGLAPIVSMTNVDGNCLVTDYDGNFTLLKISSGNK
jgi:hypothetical protein